MNTKNKIIFIFICALTLPVVLKFGFYFVEHNVKNTLKIEREAEREAVTTPIKEYLVGNSSRYRYIVDTSTGVVYLQYNGSGITVMYNADGTIVTADQLGLE